MNTENKKAVLIIGRHADMLRRVQTMLEEHGYKTAGVQTNEEAVATFAGQSFDAVIIGGGVDSESREFFHSHFRGVKADVKILDAHQQTVLSELAVIFRS